MNIASHNLKSTWLYLVFLVGIVFSGCSSEEREEGVVGSKHDRFSEAGVKADCVGCDPDDQKSAFEQARLGREGFYQKGTTWQVAFQFNIDRSNEKHLLEPGENLLTGGAEETYLFEYQVSSLDRQAFGDYLRPVAHIDVFQAPSETPFERLVSSGRLDTHEFQMTILMNDLFEGVEKRYYNRKYPNGRYVQLSKGARLRSLSDPFPVDVPHVSVEAKEFRKLPELSEELSAIAQRASEHGWLDSDWATKDYRFFAFDFEDGRDEIYWGEGDLWPSYVVTQRGNALLVRQMEVR